MTDDGDVTDTVLNQGLADSFRQNIFPEIEDDFILRGNAVFSPQSLFNLQG